jgi:SNF2 family DNA or RNA helicase
MEAKGLNGILADEMGLGKTLQTIVMLANLAVHKGIWGPHLVIAPTSCIVNWESELKRFCPAFKVLTYFGSAKARKLLRQGWSKLNSFHICITSYQLVVHDANAFRRKKWYYMILDEAHNIKNFKSKRWQTLMNFDSFRRLLLTGTPLQNNLMELWSLMHFLMPHIFQSRKEFAYWFSNPLESALEQAKSVNNDIVGKLHNIIRPFILRRLKADVAQQLPKKFEHIRFCKLSKRQKLLYEEFINTASSKTKAAEKSYLAMMNLLMQLRKVCDHPDLVEPRLIGSPYCFEGIENDVICKFVRRDMQIVDSASIFGDRNLFFWEDLGYCEQLPLLDLPVPPVMTASQDWVTQFAGVKLIRIYHRLLSSRTMYNRRCLLQNSQKSFRFIVAMMQRQQFLCSFGPKVSEDDELASVSISALSHLLKIPYVLFRLPKVISTGIRNIFVTGSSLDGCNAAMFRQHLTRYIEFPDKKMVQFDSGKLVELYRLLYEKKRGGHKCLIFTQMSRMLDILELFLNLHDFSFVRLDGSTSVEDRQKLMDRFNADPKLFCFILSTRSGGLGVNLTGADTVIFYDTDWNPAMDAQAQDRAHRIGQTREVHIYRLVSEGTIEENILRKAQQRRDLDSVVINKGKFSENSLMTMNSLQSMFNLNTESTSNVNSDFVSQQEMEAAMLAAEDVDDVAAIQVVQNEVDDNEKLAITTSDEVDPSGKVFGSSQNEDKDLADIDAETVSAGATLINDNQSENVAGEEIIEAEFEALRRRVGDSIASIQSALSAIDRYAVKFRSQYDVFVSPFYVNAQSQLESLLQSTESEMLHIADYEKQQIYRDQEAMENGEIIYATPESADLSFPEWYVEKRRAKIYERKLRAVSGQCWIHLIDNEGFPFWQNSDTGAFSYTTPAIITLRDNIEFARLRGFAGLPISILVHVFSYLISYPDRNQCALVCAKWLEASRSENLLLRVFPIESGIRESDKSRSSNIYSSIQEAVENSHAGDTILLYRGHYWEKGIELRWPLRIVSYVSEIGSCIIELTEQIIVLPSARVCIMQGLSLRCAGRLADVALVTAISCRLMMDLCSCENWSPFALTLVKVFKTDFFASRCRFSGGNCGISANESTVLLARSLVERSSTGINGIGAQQYFVDCVVRHCSIAGFNSENDATVIVRNCEFRESSLLGQIAGINNFVWKNNVC